MLLKPNKKGIILLIVIMVLELSAVGFYYWHQRQHVDQLELQYSGKKSELDQARALDSQLPIVEAKLRDQHAQLSQLEAALTTPDYVPTLLIQLQKLAEQTHNVILNLKPLPAPPAPPATPPPAAGQNGAQTPAPTPAPAGPPPAAYDKYLLEMDVQGPYKSVMAFLTGMSQFPKIIQVDRFEVTTQPPSATGKQLTTANMKCTAYVLKEN